MLSSLSTEIYHPRFRFKYTITPCIQRPGYHAVRYLSTCTTREFHAQGNILLKFRNSLTFVKSKLRNRLHMRRSLTALMNNRILSVEMHQYFIHETPFFYAQLAFSIDFSCSYFCTIVTIKQKRQVSREIADDLFASFHREHFVYFRRNLSLTARRRITDRIK